ncbi:hypothetical protein GCM10007301_07890 [Azorhizobium oxalatiphilum]|uniref:DUF6968 domain-containing protein n=1 Tax=Azorhizobium oxalatiphilum TaxID=980631 RepID=A0A917F6C7_9HYPH|nr:hypothetical protein [Azorhizobium oxalatiphilum]GGF50899.1 hypothetical protein GCM10007301_07890 [Azorhizobium oxalatiphilum]
MDVIARRTLQLWGDDDNITDVEIRIHAPKERAGAWLCRYEIDWPHGIKVMDAAGADSVQAIFIALGMIGAELYTSAYHEDGELQPWRDWIGYGFPVPRSIRDMLFGDDAKYL